MSADRHNMGHTADGHDRSHTLVEMTALQLLYVVVGEQSFTAAQSATPPAWRVYSDKTTNIMYRVTTKITLIAKTFVGISAVSADFCTTFYTG